MQPEPIFFDSDEVIIAASLAEVVPLQPLDGKYDMLTFQVSNVTGGANALADIAVDFKANILDDWQAYISSTDWANASNENVKFAASGLITTAVGSKNSARCVVDGVYAIRIRVQSAGTATVRITGTISPKV